jgi:YHS domain-containing protein
MNCILRTVLVFTFVVALSGIYACKALWACGGGHGSHESGGQAVQTKAEVKSEKAEAIKDPVCGMEVIDIKKAPSQKYKDKVYYFCSKKCVKTFKKNPAPYTCGCATMMKGCDCGHCKGKEETCPCPLEQEEGETHEHPHEHTGAESHEHKEGEAHQHD